MRKRQVTVAVLMLMLIAMALIDYASAADIYKRVRADGVTEYSDAKHAQPGAWVHIQTPPRRYDIKLIVRDRPANEGHDPPGELGTSMIYVNIRE